MSGGLIKDYVHDVRSLWLYYWNAFTYNIEGWMRKVYICFFIGSKNGLKPDFTIKLKSTLGLMVDIQICQIPSKPKTNPSIYTSYGDIVF